MKKIVAFLNYSDRKSRETEIYLKATGLPFESINVSAHPENYSKMIKLSGQTLTPCVLIDATPLDVIDEISLCKRLGINSSAKNTSRPTLEDDHTRAEQIRQRTERKNTLRFF